MKVLDGCRHILVIKLRYVGDAVWTLPVIENLKRNYPDARISVAVNDGSEFVFRNHPDVDTILSFPYRESRKGVKGLLAFLAFVKRMRGIKPDAVIDLTDNDRGAILAFLSGASTRIGYTWRRHSTNLLFNNLFRPRPFSHMVSYQLDLLKDMGLEVASDSIRIAADPVSLASLSKKHPAILQKDQRPGIVIHPGARVPLRQWGAEKFARLADTLAADHRIFIVAGPDERDVLAEVLRAMETPPEFSSADLTLAEFAALCGAMDIFVGNDSGPIHIAAAKTKVVGIYGPNTSGLAGPWSRDAFIFENPDLACRPCSQMNCTSQIYKECLEGIDPETVAKKVREMLDAGAYRGGEAMYRPGTGQEKQNWLVLSYFSRIDGMACAQHIDDRIPYLRERGVESLMLTGVCGERWPDPVHERVVSVAPSGLRFELRHLKKKGGWAGLAARFFNLVILPLYLVEKLIIDLDSQWSWFPLAIIKGSQMCGQYRAELIYSTGGPASAHLAAAMIARRHKIPWIAEFQDPLVHDDWLRSKRALKISAWLERFVCERADAVIFLSDEARKRADGRTGLGSRGWAVYPGSNPAAMPQVAYEKGDFCRFAHLGSLGGSRNLKVLLEALGHLLAERPSLGNVIRLDVYGTCDRLSLRLIEGFPVPGVVRYHGRISRSDSLIAMKRCDVLLLIQNTEEFSAETIPSKTYEYFFTGRPILALVHKNPELSRMMSQLGHTAVKADNPGDVERGISTLADRWIADCLEPSTGGGFEVKGAVDTLVGIRDRIVQRSEPAAGIPAPVRESGDCL